MNRRYDNLLFDLDGTLTDPAKGITRSVAYALQKFGIHVSDMQQLYCFIGPPLDDSFKIFYGFDNEQAQQAVHYYRERFSTCGWHENKVYDGIPDLLSSLKKAGYRLMVATSKPTPFAIRISDYFKLSTYFDFIAGSGLNGERHNKADVINYALDCCHITDLARTAMIGDRKHDVEGARQVGIDCIGVLYGYGSRAELENAGVHRTAASIEVLKEILCSPLQQASPVK